MDNGTVYSLLRLRTVLPKAPEATKVSNSTSGRKEMKEKRGRKMNDFDQFCVTSRNLLQGKETVEVFDVTP